MESGDPSVYTSTPAIYTKRLFWKLVYKLMAGKRARNQFFFCVCCFEEDHLPVFCEMESKKNPEQSKHINRQKF